MIRRSRIQQAVLGLVFAVGLTAGPALGQPPSVTGFTPRQGPPGTLVKIIGENFREVSAVEFDAAAPPRSGRFTRWRFTITAWSRARLAIFDARGHRIRLLLDERPPAGGHERLWDARDDGGPRVPPGVYYGRLEAQGRRLTHNVAVIR